ncbi:MAG TPA: CPBP family intramembrane glutamic endopeptidase [Longimicrobium sp.]|nr:CPBP family intramembrane glutamic endopeptidase [Longimicrobium sp.]
MTPRTFTSRIVIDRSPGEAAAAIGACWGAFLLALPFSESDGVDLAYTVIGGLIGAGVIVTGFAAASRCRHLPPRDSRERVRLGALAVAAGAAMGIANLGVNVAMGAAHPSIHQALRERLTTVPPERSMFAAPVLEEIAFRLFLLSVVVWLLTRVTRKPRISFLLAMGATAVFFGSVHLDRPMPDEASLALLYSVGIVVKTSAMGLVLGWSYWKWGLPYAILLHSAANAAHQLIDPLFFG